MNHDLYRSFQTLLDIASECRSIPADIRDKGEKDLRELAKDCAAQVKNYGSQYDTAVKIYGEKLGIPPDPETLPDPLTPDEALEWVNDTKWMNLFSKPPEKGLLSVFSRRARVEDYRMFCQSGEARYIDVLERALYNNVLHGLSDDGMLFFYDNPLQYNQDSFEKDRKRIAANPKATAKTERVPWFRTSCCPTNLARFITSLPGYTYAQGKGSIFVNLFESGESEFNTLEGEKVRISCKTDYPYSGKVQLAFDQAPKKKTTLLIRIPGWVRGEPVPSDLYTYINKEEGKTPLLFINGQETPLIQEKGYAKLSNKWKDGDCVEIEFDMPVRFVKANDKVQNILGTLAVERGPLVYCATLPENDKTDIRSLSISSLDSFQINKKAGIVTLTDTDRNMELIPYYRHAQEGKTQMSVFLKASR